MEAQFFSFLRKITKKEYDFMKAKVLKLLHLLGIDVWILDLVDKLLRELIKRIEAYKASLPLSHAFTTESPQL